MSAEPSKTDGSWMIVEPFANDELQDNLNPCWPSLLLLFDIVVYAVFLLARSRNVSRRFVLRERNEYVRLSVRKQVSLASAAPLKPHSIWFTKLDRELLPAAASTDRTGSRSEPRPLLPRPS